MTHECSPKLRSSTSNRTVCYVRSQIACRQSASIWSAQRRHYHQRRRRQTDGPQFWTISDLFLTTYSRRLFESRARTTSGDEIASHTVALVYGTLIAASTELLLVEISADVIWKPPVGRNVRARYFFVHCMSTRPICYSVASGTNQIAN